MLQTTGMGDEETERKPDNVIGIFVAQLSIKSQESDGEIGMRASSFPYLSLYLSFSPLLLLLLFVLLNSFLPDSM